MESQYNFQDLYTFLQKHQILSIGLIEDFSRNTVNISDCLVFSLFETVTGSLISQILSVVMLYRPIHKLGKFVLCKTEISFFQDRLTFLKKHQKSIGLNEAFSRNSLSECLLFGLRRIVLKCREIYFHFIICPHSDISSTKITK